MAGLGYRVQSSEPDSNNDADKAALFMRPGHPTLLVGLSMSRLSTIDATSGTFETKFIFRIWFVEPGLRGREAIAHGAWESWQDDYPHRPAVDALSFANSKDVTVEVSSAALVHKIGMASVPGLVKLNLWVTGTFTQTFSMERFPYDSHFLSIHFRSYFGSKDYRLEPFHDHIDFKFAFQLPDFHVYQPPLASVSNASELVGGDGSTKHRVVIAVAVQRKAFSHELNIICMLVFINLVAFTSFLMDSLADKMSVTLTLLLTTVAFKLVVADKLPPVSYLTTMDLYMISSFAFLGLVILENVLYGVANEQPVFVNAVIVSWALFQLAFFTWTQFARRPLTQACAGGREHHLHLLSSGMVEAEPFSS
ncbi:unnamed protein product [Polarella glacialis]|uniref:Neurotransmitter-gated ion-channel transmembrane domain-containing protein n=1 Tax=Polarella glacialis TaxID=89957 RepID=A0A813JMR8_POLGL|nr:unnamed protein product [Polarella glacialis]